MPEKHSINLSPEENIFYHVHDNTLKAFIIDVKEKKTSDKYGEQKSFTYQFIK